MMMIRSTMDGFANVAGAVSTRRGAGQSSKMPDSHAQCRVEPGGSASYNRPVAGFETILTLENEAATAELGARSAAALAPAPVARLSAEPGAGKTTLARAILPSRGGRGDV